MTKKDVLESMGYKLNDFPKINVVCEGVEYVDAIVFGNDECWELDRFFQYMYHDGKVYRAYYKTSSVDELDRIDYSSPYKIEDYCREKNDMDNSRGREEYVMATKQQKVNFIFENFKFKSGTTKKKLSLYPESELDKIISEHEEEFQKWLKRPKKVTYMVDGTQNGRESSWDVYAVNEEELRKICNECGIQIEKFVTARGHHRCLYCGSIANGTQKNILCDDCRDMFGHFTYDEL